MRRRDLDIWHRFTVRRRTGARWRQKKLVVASLIAAHAMTAVVRSTEAPERDQRDPVYALDHKIVPAPVMGIKNEATVLRGSCKHAVVRRNWTGRGVTRHPLHMDSYCLGCGTMQIMHKVTASDDENSIIKITHTMFRFNRQELM